MAPRRGASPDQATRALISAGLRWRWANDPEARKKWTEAARLGGVRAADKSRERMVAYNKRPKSAEEKRRRETSRGESKVSSWQVDPETGVLTRRVGDVTAT